MYYFIYIIFIFFISCASRNEQDKKNTSQEKVNFKYKRSVEISLDTLTNPATMFYQHFEKDGKNYYLHFNDVNKSIYVFDYDRQKLASILPFPKGDKGNIIDPKGFYMHNLDSIFVPSTVQKKMFLINGKGEIIKKYAYGVQEKNTNLIEIRFFSTYYGASLVNNKLYCFGNNGRRWILDLSTEKWTEEEILPKKYFEGKWATPFYFYAYQAYNPNEMTLHYTFPMTDSILCVNIRGGHKKVSYAGSKYFNENDIKTIPKNTSFEESNNAFLKSNNYKSLIYDPYRQMYYRIANLSFNDIEIKEKMHLKGKKSTIIILDKNMQKIGEIELPKYEYDEDIMCTKEGINIINTKKIRENENVIQFDVFELVEKTK